jgi:hypothetical protein
MVQVSAKGACLPRCLPAGDPIRLSHFSVYKAFVGVIVQIVLVDCPTCEQVQRDAHVFKILKGSEQVKKKILTHIYSASFMLTMLF